MRRRGGGPLGLAVRRRSCASVGARAGRLGDWSARGGGVSVPSLGVPYRPGGLPAVVRAGALTRGWGAALVGRGVLAVVERRPPPASPPSARTPAPRAERRGAGGPPCHTDNHAARPGWRHGRGRGSHTARPRAPPRRRHRRCRPPAASKRAPPPTGDDTAGAPGAPKRRHSHHAGVPVTEASRARPSHPGFGRVERVHRREEVLRSLLAEPLLRPDRLVVAGVPYAPVGAEAHHDEQAPPALVAGAGVP
ncbi:hypothetical protein SUDANB66_02980 [Streptomyces sp. SudanB66_2053]